MTLLVTGASGFLGSAVFSAAKARGLNVRPVLRRFESTMHFIGTPVSTVIVPSLAADTDWSIALLNVDAVIHCAARVPERNDKSINSLAVFRDINVAGTLNLAMEAAKSGVKRFVFVSSIKVNGERTSTDVPFRSSDVPCPEDAYGISKCEAEVGLHKIASETGMELVIVRPPLVYGPRVKGNFLTMLRCLQHGIPLPLGSITENRRSLVALDNLVDLLVKCIDHPAAANETFLVSDGVDLSTADLLRRLGVAMDKPARLLPVPPVLLRAAAMLSGKGDMVQRLLGDLQVDISHTCKILGWKPPISVDEGLRRAARGFCE